MRAATPSVLAIPLLWTMASVASAASATEPPPASPGAPPSPPAAVPPPAATEPAAIAAGPAAPGPADANGEASGGKEEKEDDGVGVNIDVMLATAYVFRGLNVFQSSRQLDPHALLAPGVSWSIADSGVTVGYWSAYQLTGRNIGENIDGAVGVEQDLYVTYDLDLGNDMTLGFGFQGYMFPAADPDVAGAVMPTFLEPGASFTYSPGIDLGVKVAYLAGVQSAEAIADYRYLYVNPSVGSSFELSRAVALALQAGYGFKIFNSGNEGRDNVHDVLFSVAAPIRPGGGTGYATPGLGVAWTNVEDVLDEDTGETAEERSFVDGWVVWGSLCLGMDL